MRGEMRFQGRPYSSRSKQEYLRILSMKNKAIFYAEGFVHSIEDGNISQV
jgi:hypothetical protein